jgi:hypothetical protein
MSQQDKSLINEITVRPHWPHTVEDILNSLDGIWGLVGAEGINGNLFRLERSLHEPVVYTLIEHKGKEEGEIVNKRIYQLPEKMAAVNDFAQALGFTVSN